MTRRRVVVVGDALLDVDLDGDAERLCPDAPVPVVSGATAHPRAGGAGLAATMLAADGHDVVLATALAHDVAGRQLADFLEDAGVTVVEVARRAATSVKTRVRARDQALLRLDTGDDLTPRPLGRGLRHLDGACGRADAVLVSDYGAGVTRLDGVRRALARAVERCPVVWDPHPRGTDPVAGVRVVTPNLAELARVRSCARDPHEVATAADAARAQWGATMVAVTMGERGALLVGAGPIPMAAPPRQVVQADACGAGDRFASALAGALADSLVATDALVHAVDAAVGFLCDGGVSRLAVRGDGATVDDEPDAIVARVRGGGGCIVATSGCFELLHAGHVESLRAARALGDCLVVCLNSDRSVRRLKGDGRPLQGQDDRAQVLLALACVDAVVVFDEDTPVASLERLRPDVFVKGGDYGIEELPEAATLSSWGGRTVTVPYLPGRSTSALVEGARRDAR
jgi:D-beta-D-heptose 7-phosphate kinase / D-beta-D-heptose 1-phosphate adenosyltransferase